MNTTPVLEVQTPSGTVEIPKIVEPAPPILSSSDNKVELKIPISLLRGKKMFLATPMYGGMCAGIYTKSVADLASVCKQIGIDLLIYFLFNESLITRARNYCCDEFMRSPASHLLFIDSDIGFNPQDVIALLALSSEPGNPYDVIGAPYPKKCISWEKIRQAVHKGFADQDPNKLERCVGDYVFNPVNNGPFPLNKPVEVLEIGTGFMMIKREAFDKYTTFFPHYHYKPDHIRTKFFDGSREIMAFFDCIIDRGYDIGDTQNLLRAFADGKISADELKAQTAKMFETEKRASKRYLSEDYMFCQNLRRAGIKTYLCPWMQTQHVGTYVFGGSVVDLAAIGASATADAGQLQQIRKDVEQHHSVKPPGLHDHPAYKQPPPSGQSGINRAARRRMRKGKK